MTRILVQRGSSGSSSSNANRSSSVPGSSSARAEQQAIVPPTTSAVKDEDSGGEIVELVGDELLECSGTSDSKPKSDEILMESLHNDQNDTLSDEITDNKAIKEELACPQELIKGLSGLRNSERHPSENEGSGEDSSPTTGGSSYPPPPPVPPPKPSAANLNSRRNVSGSSNAVHIGSPRRVTARPVVSTRTSPAGSRPSSPRSHTENEGYNSADEQSPCFGSSYDDLVSSLSPKS